MQRRDFLKKSSALIVGFNFISYAGSSFASPESMDKKDVNAWLQLDSDGFITIYSGKVDLGTGVKTALIQMTADELDVPMGKIKMVMGDTGTTIDQGQTAGSLSIKDGGVQIRAACATARNALINQAAQYWGVSPSDVSTTGDGSLVLKSKNLTITYNQLLKNNFQSLEVDAKPVLKKYSDYRYVGKSVPRVDIPAKVTGEFTYVHDVKIPGMLHARVIFPKNIGSKLISVDVSSVSSIPGFVKLVRKDDYLAVVAKTEWGAVQAAKKLKVQWSDWQGLPSEQNMYAVWRGLEVLKVEERQKRGDVALGLQGSVKQMKASYQFPIHSHASMGPSCAVASFKDGKCEIWSPSQATHSLQTEIASVLGVNKANVRLHYVDGSGCYGRNGHEDCSADAALISMLAGAPVRVQWMREDELGWDPKSPPTIVDLEGGLDKDGNVVAWKSNFILSAQNGTLEEYPLLSAVHSGLKRTGVYTGNIVNNSDVEYVFPNAYTKVSRVNNVFLRTSHLRTPGRMQNNFANECFMDELAAAAGKDPIQFRLAYLKDPRSIDVIKAVAKSANWEERSSPSKKVSTGNIAKGRGFAYVRYQNNVTYVGMVAEVEVNKKTGHVKVSKIYCSHDCGMIVNPDGAINQIEGGIHQTVSRTLIENVTFDNSKVTSVDWGSYPIMKFPEIPEIKTILIDRPDAPPWGAGEMSATTVPAAISNAIFDAVGVRMRTVPFTDKSVLEELKKKSV